MKSRRARFGVHARAVMSDRRWLLLPLSARSAWLQLTDVADVMPELRAPSGDAPDLVVLARALAADTDELKPALDALVLREVLAPVGRGFRLKAY